MNFSHILIFFMWVTVISDRNYRTFARTFVRLFALATLLMFSHTFVSELTDDGTNDCVSFGECHHYVDNVTNPFLS